MKRNGTGRLFAALLALIMVLVLLPVGAAKASGGYLAVGGTDIDLSQNGSYFDGKVVFEIVDGKNVLTLNGYKLENYNGNGISADGIDLTIVGSAEIGVTGTVSSAISVYESNLTLNGDFTLRAQSVTGATLDVYGYLTVEGGALDVENTGEGRNAIYVYDRMTVNGGTVHAKTNGAKAISARDGITLNNGEAFLSGNANASEVFIGKQYPLYVGGEQVNDLNKGDIFGDGTAKFEIIDGKNVLTLNGYKLENYIGVGISADGIDLTIVGSAEIGVTGAVSSAISVYESNLTLNGDFTLRAQCQTGTTIFVIGYLTVEGGALDVENTGEGSEAIYVNGAMTVNGGTVHAKANGTNAINARIILNNGEAYLLGDANASEVKIGVPEHTVTVVDGTADKTSAKAGDTVTITADDAEYGYAFLQWEMLEDVEFAKGDALTTTFKMPDHDVTVTPVYKEILISDIDDQTYTGEEITLTFGRNDLTLDGVDVALINGTDYSLTYANNVNAGTATVTVTFHDRETKEPDVRMGTKSKTFRILPASIAAAEIAEIVDQTYQGKELTPEPTVTWNGKVLEKDKDYTLRYFNNVNVGTNPYVTVTGKGNFDESTDVGQSFTIIPAPLTITAIDQEYTYNGYPQGEGDTTYATPAEIAQKVTVEGLQGDDKLTSVILDGDATEPKTYPGRIQPSDAVIGNATGTVTGNYEITYVPGTLTIKPCNYTITFVNEDGTELQSGEVLLGKTPAYTGKEPTKPATAQYTYTFAGWKDENGTEYGLTDDLPAANGDMTYTAIYTSTVNEYTITFVNEDGTVLQEELLGYGEMPEYKGETPEKPHTAHNEYAFAGWTPEIVPVTQKATYIATYTEDLLHPTFVGSELNAYDNCIVEDGEVLYRFDVTVRDLLNGVLSINSAQIFVTYDHDTLAFRKGEGAVAWELHDIGEVLSAVWASDADVEIKEGDVILTLWFAKVGEPKEGGIVDIAFTTGSLGDGSALSFVNEGSVLELEARTDDGFLQFDELLLGDANCDGAVTAADAALVLRAVVGLSELTPRGALQADVDGDLEVTAADAALILRFVVGLIDGFSANE